MKLIELRPDRTLLKPNFDGYKLSLEPIPTIRTELAVNPSIIHQSDSQFSLLHAQIYGLQNHLVKDPWIVGSCYFIDANWMIQKVQFDEKIGRLVNPSAVFKIPRIRPKQAGDYNASFVFINEKFCLLNDGIGSIKLIETGDRQKSSEWKLKQAENMGSTNGSLLLDARFEIKGNLRQIHFVLIHVQHNDKEFENILEWITLGQNEDSKWIEESKKILNGKGYPYYCALEPKSTGLIISSDKPFTVKYDSLKPIEEGKPDHMEVVQEEMAMHLKLPFSWTQTDEEINITFDQISEKDLKVTSKNHLQVLLETDVIMDSEKFFHKIDSELTTWIKEKDSLQITCYKQEGMLWPFLYNGAPEEKISDSAMKEVDEENKPPAISTLDRHMEDCDFGMEGDLDQDYTIERIDAISHEKSHKIFLGSSPPLFKISLRPGQPDAIVLRNDVDACIWLQNITSGDWTLKHEGTLNAFGYIQASKQQKKFLGCSPDMNYAIICEAQRHIFVYKGNYNTNLRNRNGPQVSIGQQKLITLEDCGEILGLCVENDVTILLTEQFLICLQLCIEE